MTLLQKLKLVLASKKFEKKPTPDPIFAGYLSFVPI
jgi:hypothetical protein